MTVKLITDGELKHLYETLDAVIEEFVAIDDTTPYVFTSGAQEMVGESMELVYKLLNYQEPLSEEELENLDSL